MVNENTGPWLSQVDLEFGFKVAGLIGKQVVFKTNEGTTGFVVDDVQAHGEGWMLRASREDGRALYVENVEDLLNGSIPAPSAWLFNFDVSKRPQCMGSVSIA